MYYIISTRHRICQVKDLLKTNNCAKKVQALPSNCLLYTKYEELYMISVRMLCDITSI